MMLPKGIQPKSPLEIFQDILKLNDADFDSYLVKITDEEFSRMIELISLLKEKSRRIKSRIKSN